MDIKSDTENNNEETIVINSKMKKNMSLYLVFQPIVGLIISIALVIIFLICKVKWSIPTLLYSLLPLGILTLIYALLYIPLHKILDLSPIFLKGKLKYLTITLVVVLVGLSVLLFKVNPRFEYKNVSLNQLENINAEKNEDYFVLFTSRNCIYCANMSRVYLDAFETANLKEVYYCDLTNESPIDTKVKDRDISEVPILVRYKNNSEVSRIIGIQNVDDIISFVK